MDWCKVFGIANGANVVVERRSLWKSLLAMGPAVGCGGYLFVMIDRNGARVRMVPAVDRGVENAPQLDHR